MPPRNRLAKLLLDDDKALETDSGAQISKVGLEQLTDISKYLKGRISRYTAGANNDYDPLFEIAKVALDTADDGLKFRCNAELARYQYPQIRSLEIAAQKDNEVNIKIELAGYARPPDTEIEVADIDDHDDEADESEEAEYRYVDSVLKQAEKKDIS